MNMGKKIYITRAIPEIGVSTLRSKGYEVDIWPKDAAPSKKQLVRALKKKPYDGVISLLTDTIDKDIFDAAPSARIFANYADGYNNIDLKEAAKRGIMASNTPGVSSDAVAEHAIALMLALSTRLVEADSYMRKGRYKGWAPMHFIGPGMNGKTIGLIGVGHIGSQVARALKKGFDARIVYYDVMPNAEIETECEAQRKDSVESVLREADIVSLHVPLLDSTHHLINSERLALMKPTALIVNTSRGPVIDEKALVDALRSGKIAGAGLDVFEFEPKLARGLAKLKNTVLTPHIASARQNVRDEMARMAAENIISALEIGAPKNPVR